MRRWTCLVFALALVTGGCAKDGGSLVDRVITAYGGNDVVAKVVAVKQTGRIVSPAHPGKVGSVIRGKPDAIRAAIVTLLSRGHLLIEDIPGVGKTTLARALAAALGGAFRRIQFTSDLLPSDIVGVSIYDQAGKVFELKRGPIFANVVLADEINRTTPRTQSALLEAMSEGHVTIDDTTHTLAQPFVVIATQNPAEHYGT